MQLLAKFKKILYMGFSATLNFPAYQNSIIRKKFTMPFLKYKSLKLKLRVFEQVIENKCFYGNLLCPESNTNVFTNDWAIF